MSALLMKVTGDIQSMPHRQLVTFAVMIHAKLKEIEDPDLPTTDMDVLSAVLAAAEQINPKHL
jgi:hypothetical protein